MTEANQAMKFLTILVCAAAAGLQACAGNLENATGSADRPPDSIPATSFAEATELPDANVAEVDVAAGDPSGDLVCRREVATGTHFRVRRCYTKAQLEEMREEAQQIMRDARSGGFRPTEALEGE